MLRITKRRHDGHSVFSLFKSVALGFVCLSTWAALRADDHTRIPAYAAGKVESPFPAWLEFPIGTSRWTPSVHNSREKTAPLSSPVPQLLQLRAESERGLAGKVMLI